MKQTTSNHKKQSAWIKHRRWHHSMTYQSALYISLSQERPYVNEKLKQDNVGDVSKPSAGNISECFQNHAQRQIWTSAWWLFHKFHEINARLMLSYKSGESKWNPHWMIELVSSHGTNCILNEHEDFCHYDPYAIPFKMIPWYRHPACFVNQNDILIE